MGLLPMGQTVGPLSMEQATMDLTAVGVATELGLPTARRGREAQRLKIKAKETVSPKTVRVSNLKLTKLRETSHKVMTQVR
jgi:hypothetical protein